MIIDTVQIDCAECKIPFWITNGADDRFRKEHKTFYCPNGHTNFYPQKTDAEILKGRLADKDIEIADLQKQLRKKARRSSKKK